MPARLFRPSSKDRILFFLKFAVDEFVLLRMGRWEKTA